MKKTKLNEANYYSQEMNKQYFSVSQYKDFCKCEAMAMAKINGTYEQAKGQALFLGSFVDEMLTGTQESQVDFIVKNRLTLFQKNSKLNKLGDKDFMLFVNEFFPTLFYEINKPYAEIVQALETIERIKKQPLMMKHLSGEHQVVMIGKIAGVPFKIKMDSYHPDKMIVDLKYMSSLRSPNMFDSMVKYWGYDIQGAIYQEVVRQNTGKRLPFYLDIGTKEKPAHLDIAEIKQYDLDSALDNVISRVARFDLVKQGKAEPERCEEYDCDYCTTTRIITEPIDSNQLGMARKFF